MPRYKNDGYPAGIFFNNGSFYKISSVKQADGKWKSIRTPLKDQAGNKIKTNTALFAYLAGVDPGAQAVASSKTVNDAIVAFKKEKVPKNSPQWQKRQCYFLDKFAEGYGTRDPNTLEPLDFKRFLLSDMKKSDRDPNKEASPAKARQAKAVLAVFFDYMTVEKYCDLKANPVTLIEVDVVEGRDRDVTEEEYWSVYNIANTRMKIAMLLARGTGMRQFDFLNKTLGEVTDEGIKNEQHKRRKGKKKVKQFFEHNAYTELAIQLGDELRREVGSVFLLPTRAGTAYTTDGFATVWDDLMEKAIELGLIKKRFGTHDIRAMVGADQEDHIEASKVLGNTPAVAKKHYRRRHEHIKNKAAPTNVVDLLERAKHFAKTGS